MKKYLLITFLRALIYVVISKHVFSVKVTQLCPTLCNPMDSRLPCSSVHGRLQSRILEEVAIPFPRGSFQPRNRTRSPSLAEGFFRLQEPPRKLYNCINSTPWTIQSMEFSRPEYWSGWPFPSPGDLPNPGTEPRPPTLQEDSLPAVPQRKPKNTGVSNLFLLQGIFPTQESNWGLLYCRRILYQLS